MRGWGRDCFPLSNRHTSLHSECLAQVTSQEAPQTFVPPFHPSVAKKLKVKKSIFERDSVAAKFRFLYQEAEFFAKIQEYILLSLTCTVCEKLILYTLLKVQTNLVRHINLFQCLQQGQTNFVFLQLFFKILHGTIDRFEDCLVEYPVRVLSVAVV